MADLQIAPLKIVGYEGLFGAIIMIFVMLPVVQFLPGADGKGIHEDTIENLEGVSSSQILLRTVLLTRQSWLQGLRAFLHST